MFFTVDALVAHAVGDYFTQSHWMANEKTKRWFPALIHVLLYGVPFLFITRSIPALLVIVSTHFIIDHWRLAKHVVWLKNFIGPVHILPKMQGNSEDGFVKNRWPRLTSGNPSWGECKGTGGFPPDTPIFMWFWLMVIVDNLIHVLINGAALHWLT